MPGPIKIAPSILSGDFAALGSSVSQVATAGADWIHVDVMDGHFVPNLTFGPPIIRAIRKSTTLPFDVHLMVERPEEHLLDYVEAGADSITVHVEACRHLQGTLASIRKARTKSGDPCKAGVSLNPGTPLSAIEEVLPDLDLVLLMTVNPGFGGQTFIPQMVDKIRRCRAMLDAGKSRADISVDGGISAANAGDVTAAGATVLVAGSAIFQHASGLREGIQALRTAVR